MKITFLLLLTVLFAGCASVENRPLLSSPPREIAVGTSVKVFGQGLSKSEWVELPAGVYISRFERDGSRYYLRDDPLVRIKTLYPETQRPGGIVYYRLTGRFHAFAAMTGPIHMWMGVGLATVGSKGQLLPFPMGVVPDEVLATFKDEANKPLHGTPAEAPSSSTESEGRRP
ncbi:MAG: hypothetical protein IPL39_12350 [Opitutaceae bacterium]|nr:hypothetical protein [Opitutaceae bacterium]